MNGVFKEQKEKRVNQAFLVLKVLLDPLAQKVQKEMLDHQDFLEIRENLVYKDPEVNQEKMEKMGNHAHQGLPVSPDLQEKQE